MGLIAWDGFDNYASAVDLQQNFGTLQYFNTTDAVIISPGRAGYGKQLELGGTFNNFGIGLSNAARMLTLGFAINLLGNGAVVQIEFLDQLAGGAAQCVWTLNPENGTITFANAAGTVLATALNAIVPSGSLFIELQAQIGQATGTYPGTAALRVNGQPVDSFPDLTGLNTQATANASASGFNIRSSNGQQFYFDDLQISDETVGPGAYPCNSFLGDLRTASLFAISNSAVAWTPLANQNWQEISETAMDGDASYNYTATAGAQDTFNFGALEVDVNQVIGLQIKIAVRKEDAGSRTVAPVIIIGGTAYVGTAVSVDVTYLYITSLWPINPHTEASWTAADINALIGGYVVVT